jgi:hypothetical protein
MNNVPLLVIALLVMGTALLPAVYLWRPARLSGVAFLVAAAAGLIWLPAGRLLPLSFTFSNWPAALSLPAWHWSVDEVAWLLSALWLLLLVAALLINATLGLPGTAGSSSDDQVAVGLLPVWPALQPALLLLLGAAGLISVWSDSLAGLLSGWTLLAAVWILLFLLAGPLKESRRGSENTPARLLVRLGAGLSAPLFLWLAAAALPEGTHRGGLLAEIAQWPLPVTAWLLLAAAWQMGIFPLHLWRPLDWRLPPHVAALIHVAPALAGLSLLIRLVTATGVALDFGLPLTALGLLGVLAGAVMAVSITADKVRATAALALGHAGLAFLVGMWAGGEALLAEARVLLVAAGLLFLSVTAQDSARPPWFAAGPLLAAAALVGLPLTAGFAGRAALYQAWLDNGRIILVLVSTLLHIPLLAAAFQIAWGSRPISGGVAPVNMKFGLLPAAVMLPEREQWRGLLPAVALLLPAMTLVSASGLEAHLVVWLALLAPLLAAVALLRYVPQLRDGQRALRQVVGLELPLGHLFQNVGRLLAVAGYGLRQATTILEGEGGMLWLLLLLVVFWLAWLV